MNPAARDRAEVAVPSATTEPPADQLDDRPASVAPFDRAALPILLVDGARRVRHANDAAADLIAHGESGLSGLLLDELLDLEAGAGWDATWARLLAAGWVSGLLSLERGDGAALEVHYSAIARIDGELHLLTLFAPPALDGFIDSEPLAASVLTRREREVLSRLARGVHGREIAEELAIAPETVRRHVAKARQKLGARSRVHAVALALDRGEIALVTPPRRQR